MIQSLRQGVGKTEPEPKTIWFGSVFESNFKKSELNQ